MAAQAAEDALDVLDSEHDATDAEGIDGCDFWVRPDGRRRVELVQLDASAAVRRSHRRDRGSNTLEADEAIDGLALDDRLTLELQAEFGKERFHSFEVVDDDEDVVHPKNRH